MQCPNCQFENMPGNTACVRCGSAVAFAGMQIAVYPPRAQIWAKHARRWMPWRRAWYVVRDGLRELEDWVRNEASRTMVVEDWTPALTAKSLVPGWVHWSLGHRARGLV